MTTDVSRSGPSNSLNKTRSAARPPGSPMQSAPPQENNPLLLQSHVLLVPPEELVLSGGILLKLVGMVSPFFFFFLPLVTWHFGRADLQNTPGDYPAPLAVLCGIDPKAQGFGVCFLGQVNKGRCLLWIMGCRVGHTCVPSCQRWEPEIGRASCRARV